MAIDTGSNSFIENVNIVANATQLATGDVIEDAERAKNAAVAAAEEAEQHAIDALASENKAEDWAIKPYNSVVEGSVGAGTDKYSSYHWSEIAKLNAGDAVINDAFVSTLFTWSSDKINAATIGKADNDHNHDLIYEPVISPKNSAFNKLFFTGTNAGSAITVSRGDHLHDGVYEQTFNKNSGFNLPLGTTTGTVSQGDHNHDFNYMPNAAQNSAYNKSFVVDPEIPSSEEIPRGNHYHRAQGITHDPAGNNVATSTNVQGAISQLDGKVTGIRTTERTKIVAGMANGATEIVTMGTVGVATVISANLVQNYESNALYNNNGIEISYDSLAASDKPGSPGTSLIEGQFHLSLTITGEVDTEYIISPVLFDGTTWIEPSNYKIVGGATSGSPAGMIPMSFSAFVGNLYDKNAEGRVAGDNYKIGVQIYSSSTNNIVISGMVMSWAGQGEGSMVSTGETMNHADLSGLGAGTTHSTSDISGLDTTLGEKVIKVIPASVDNVATLDAVGNIKDSGVLIGEFSNKMNLVASPVLDNFITMDSAGNSKESGMNTSTFAPAVGNATQTFLVNDAETGSKQAVNKVQVEAHMLRVTYLTDQDMIDYSSSPELDGYATHVGAVNPHGTTAGDINAASVVHTHTQADVTGLTDALLLKYDIVSGAVQNNLPAFDIAGALKDSAIGIDSISINRGSIDDLNNADEIGFYYFDAPLNSPDWSSVKRGIVVVNVDDLGEVYQTAIQVSNAGNERSTRGKSSVIPSWSNWTVEVNEKTYATETSSGVIKIRVTGTDCFITTSNTNP